MKMVQSKGFGYFLIAAFGTVVILMTAVGTTSLTLISRIKQSNNEIVSGFAQDLVLAGRLRAYSESYVASGRGYILTMDGKYLDKMADANKGFDDTIERLKAAGNSVADLNFVSAIERADHDYHFALRRVIQERQSGTPFRMLSAQIEEQTQPLRDALENSIVNYNIYRKSLLAKAAQDNAAAADGDLKFITLFLVLAVCVGTLMTALISKRFKRLTGRLSDAIVAREEIVKVVSHDLKNPMAVIDLNVQLLRRMPLDEKTERRVQAVDRALQRMKSLTFGLLDLSKIRAGNFVLVKKMNFPSMVAQEAFDLLEPLAVQRGISFKMKLGASLSPLLFDYERIMQVLSNLVGNAIKYTPRGGEIALSVSETAEGVVFSLHNTGTFIAPDKAEKVFQPYWTGDASGKYNMGLGLAIAKGIVEAHGGQISILSSESEGTRFEFDIPTDAAAVLRSVRPGSEAQGRTIKFV